MTIHLDTSALAAPSGSSDRLRAFIADGHRLRLSSIVLYEWLRGPRTLDELHVQGELFPRDQIVSFDARAAARAADLYRNLTRPRRRAADFAIAACALVDEAALWTLNPKDFGDVPGLTLA